MKKTILFAAVFAFAGMIGTAGAQDLKAGNLDELLEQVRTGAAKETAAIKAREAEFVAARSRQAQLLRQAKQTQANEEKRSDRLETQFENNETKLGQLEKTLADRLGTLAELFGVMRTVAGDTSGLVKSSVISAQFPGREKFLGMLAQRKELPKIEEIERLWYELMREMTESGKVAKFTAPVITLDGQQVEQDVVRVGAFNVVSNGQYLNYDVSLGKLAELPRQPQSRYLSWASDLQEASSGLVDFGVDPTRGSILAVLIEKPTLWERTQQGGIVGYIIIAIGIVGVLLVIARVLALFFVGNKVSAQMKNVGSPDTGNPLGRVLAVYSENTNVDVETLELKLDDAILKEVPKLETGLSTVKVISVIAPLLGLLGTVTGMIATFQAITLFGTGDPKLMAGGISQALVTTVLGLVVAIPTVLLHSLVAGRSKRIVQILEEQSAGLIAAHAEEHEG